MKSFISSRPDRRFRVSQFLVSSSERDNHALIFAGPTMVSMGVAVGGSKYADSMKAKVQTAVPARSEDVMDLKDSTVSLSDCVRMAFSIE